MKRFLVAPEAVQDLQEIWQYIAEDNLLAADRMVERFYSTFLRLASSPGIGHSREDLAETRPLLFFPVGNYLIVYRSINRRKMPIEIVAVVQGNRDVPVFLHRRNVQ